MVKTMGKENYGYYYWCIKTVEGVSKDKEIYINADEVEITQNGDLVFWHTVDEKRVYQNLSISKGNWIVFYAASVMDGSAVAVSHWKGEYID